MWYYVNAERQQSGPLSTADLKQSFRDGTLTPDTLVWRDGMLQWRALGDLAAQLGLAHTPPPADEVRVAAPSSPPTSSGPLPPAPPPSPAAPEPEAEPPPLTGRAVFSLGLEPMQQSPSAGNHANAERNPYAPSQAPLVRSALYGRSVADVDDGVVYAGFWKRVAASLIDSTLLSLAGGITGEVFGTIFSDLFGGGEMSRAIWIVASTLTLNVLYYAGFHSTLALATPGKMLIGIKVVRGDGEAISFLRGVARFFATWLGAFTLGIGYLMAAFTARKQALHDVVCDTVVVDKWAFTDHPGMQRRELGGITLLVLIGVPVLNIVIGIALGISQALRNLH
jgi:uncharacterized RDD family membrane protein YckC